MRAWLVFMVDAILGKSGGCILRSLSDTSVLYGEVCCSVWPGMHAGRIFEKLQSSGTEAQLLNNETLPKIIQVNTFTSLFLALSRMRSISSSFDLQLDLILQSMQLMAWHMYVFVT